MPSLDLSILNQRQTPAFYADILANRPAAGFIGRIFVSTDTYAFYRDNGTSWDLIGGPGTGTVTGTGTTGQVTYWNGASTITGSNNLFWDNATGHLGINNTTPGTALDVHDTQSTVLQLNQLTATNDTRIAFQNAGTSLWRIGNFYNAGANDWGIYDVVGAAQPLTIKKTTGQVLIGTSTVGAGKLVVSSASADNGVQVVGASAPSVRIDNAATGATKRAGLGISTATNNFIQGSADRDFCIFNGSTAAASPILFGVYDAGAVNVQEAARISAARNFLIGTTTDAGYKLNVNGTVYFNSTSYTNGIATFGSSGGSGLRVYGGSGTHQWDIYLNSTNLRFSDNTGGGTFVVDGAATFSNSVTATSFSNAGLQATEVINATKSINGYFVGYFQNTNANGLGLFIQNGNDANDCLRISNAAGTDNPIKFFGSGKAIIGGNLLIGTTTDNGAKLQVQGDVRCTAGFIFNNQAGSNFFSWYGSTNIYASNSAIGNIALIAAGTGIYTALSDKNKKKNFEESNLGLDAILKLKPTLYNMINQKDTDSKELGFIAQEVKEVISQAYVEEKDFIGLNDRAILATVVKAIQELNTKIENLK